jgi:hypothetical protein
MQISRVLICPNFSIDRSIDRQPNGLSSGSQTDGKQSDKQGLGESNKKVKDPKSRIRRNAMIWRSNLATEQAVQDGE